MNSFAPICLKVQSNSMWPLIRKGDHVLLADADHAGKGDVITYFTSYGKILTHRILFIDEKCFQTKGDAHIGPERTEDRSRIIGKVEIIKRGRRQHILLGSRAGGSLFTCYAFLDQHITATWKFLPPSLKGICVLLKQLIFPVYLLAFITIKYESRIKKIL